jgi:hypothetical protein
MLYAQGARLRGRVIDPGGVALAGASIEIVGTLLRTTTGTNGSFELSLPAKSWLVRVRQLGFLPESVTVAPPFELLTVTLAPHPIELKGVTVVGGNTPPMARTVTPGTVRQVPPLGEPDIFRAIVLLPAVSQPNDLKGRIHLAGGSSDETAVELDGHPLQDPFHLVGLLGAFNVAALDRADVMIHHLPVETDGRLGGLIELQSRKSATPKREVVVSLLSTSLTFLQPSAIGGANVLASGRITYLDHLVGVLGNHATINGDETPLLGYRDALVTVDRPFGNTLLSGVWFYTRDRRPFGGGTEYAWGESMGGLRTTTRAGSWVFDSRVSFNRATANLGDDPGPGPTGVQFVDLRHDWVSGGASVKRFEQTWGWEVGFALDAKDIDQAWTGSPEDFFSPSAPRAYRGAQSQTRGTGFLELTKTLGTTTAASLGARVTHLAGESFTSPRVLLTTTLGKGAKVSFGVSRRFQFETELEEPSEGSGKQPLFLLSEPRQADVAAISVANKLGDRGDWEVATFYRRYENRTKLHGNPRAFEDSAGVPVDSFPLFDRVPGRGYGATVSFTRQFGSRSLVQGAYTFQRIFDQIEGAYIPTAWDAPHSVSIFATTPISAKWSFNGVLQWHSGPAATPVMARVFAPDPELSPFLLPRYLPGSANSGRLSAYRRVDVGVRRDWNRGKTEIAFNAQILNILFRKNALEYDFASAYCTGSNACKTAKPTSTGLPIVPSLGVEIRW